MRASGSDGQISQMLGGGAATRSGAAAAAASAAKPHSSSAGDLAKLHALAASVDVSQHANLYADANGGGGGGGSDGPEPELRRQLRERRLAEKHTKMKAALAEKQANEEAEVARRAAAVAFKEANSERISQWRNKHKGNVRGMLASLQSVLWEDSGWVPLGMGDLLEPSQVRKAWMKANLLVHPDKVRQRHGGAEQEAIADLIFDALKDGLSQLK